MSAGRPPERLVLREQLDLAEDHRQIQIGLRPGLSSAARTKRPSGIDTG